MDLERFRIQIFPIFCNFLKLLFLGSINNITDLMSDVYVKKYVFVTRKANLLLSQ